MARRAVATARRTVNPRRNVRRRRRLARAVGADRARVSARTRPRDPSLSALRRQCALTVHAAARDRLGAVVADRAMEPWQLVVVRLNVSDYVLGIEPLRARAS